MHARDLHLGVVRASSTIVRECAAAGSHCAGPLREAVRPVRESSIGDAHAIVSGHTPANVEESSEGHRYSITGIR